MRPQGFVATTAGTEFALLLFERVDPQSAHRWKVRHTLGGHADQVAAVAVSPDGRTVVSSGRAGAVRLWDAATGGVRSELKGHARFVHLLSFSPDGSAVAGASPDGSARVWDTVDGKVRTVLTGKTDGFSTLAYSPDGRALVATFSAGDSGRVTGEAHVWDAATGERLPGLTRRQRLLGFSPIYGRSWSAATSSARISRARSPCGT